MSSPAAFTIVPTTFCTVFPAVYKLRTFSLHLRTANLLNWQNCQKYMYRPKSGCEDSTDPKILRNKSNIFKKHREGAKAQFRSAAISGQRPPHRRAVGQHCDSDDACVYNRIQLQRFSCMSGLDTHFIQTATIADSKPWII